VVNAICLILFFFFIYAQRKDEKKAAKYYLANKAYCSDYSVEIQGFNQNDNELSVLADVYSHVKGMLKTGEFEESIVDIQVAGSHKKFMLQKRSFELKVKASSIIKKFKSNGYYEMKSEADYTSIAMEKRSNEVLVKSTGLKTAMNFIKR